MENRTEFDSFLGLHLGEVQEMSTSLHNCSPSMMYPPRIGASNSAEPDFTPSCFLQMLQSER
jgi:hypothetical protein